VGGQPHDPATFTPAQNILYYFTGGWVGFGDRSGRVQKTPPTPGFEIRTTQFVANRYIVYTVLGELYFVDKIRNGGCNVIGAISRE
jgi:hypothetical protein